uniref:H15 domain-containing protein n=1 Tax=Oreochromis aureus TaxID=47969 RepID=A0AAZ1XD99_OREAU
MSEKRHESVPHAAADRAGLKASKTNCRKLRKFIKLPYKEKVLLYRFDLKFLSTFTFRCCFNVVYEEEKTQEPRSSRCGCELQAGLSLHGSHGVFKFQSLFGDFYRLIDKHHSVNAMAEVAPAAAPAPAAEAAPAKAPAKKKKAAAGKTAKKSGPSASELIVKAVKESKERKGLSLAAIKKDLVARGYDVEHNSAHVRRALKSLVQKGALVHTTGTGASGSFKAAKPAEKPKKAAKKPAAKVKKPAAKKATAAKKPATAKKPKAAKATPKKAKKPAAAAKSPKVKKTAAPKKAATPKKPAKKAAKPKAAKAKKATPKKK